MTRMMALLVVALGMSMGLGAQAERSAGSSTEYFCPECWNFTTEGFGLDMEGRCLGCGKQPVLVQAVEMAWLWCPAHNAWHRKACPQTPAQLPDRSIALLNPLGGPRMTPRAYCPGDRVLEGTESIGQACPVCTRPMIRVEAATRRWFWCTSGNEWRSEPCTLNAVRHCCTPRQGAILSYPFQLPLPHPIATREPLRTDRLLAQE